MAYARFAEGHRTVARTDSMASGPFDLEAGMRRSILFSLFVLGAVITAVGSTGVFAALVDTAHTGTNDIASTALRSSADLQLASANLSSTDDGIDCGRFSDNLTSGIFLASSLQPGQFAPTPTSPDGMFCLRNRGSQAVALTIRLQSLTDVETDCTGDEALYDNTCGDGQVGELAHSIYTSIGEVMCPTPGTSGPIQVSSWLDEPQLTSGIGSWTVAPGETRCFTSSARWGSEGRSSTETQQAQSDRVTWQWGFVGQVPTP